MDESQILILGNGFDLHCGLKSSYKDFFRSEILDTTVISFGRKQMQAGVSGFWEGLLLEYYKSTNRDNYNWCDIETIIKDTLWKLFVKSNLCENGLFAFALESVNIKRDLNDLNISFNNIEDYLIQNCIVFISNNKNRYMTDQDLTNLLVKALNQELRNLETRFCKFLKNQIVNLNNQNEKNKDYILKAVNLIAKLTGFAPFEFKQLDDIFSVKNKKHLTEVFKNLNDVFILNFNYTALFDILEVHVPYFYNNVHGKLCHKNCAQNCEGSNVIFGIDDNLIQSQNINSELRLFSKTYRKMLNSDKFAATLPPKEDEVRIKFYGHSLSEADYSYFQSIFDCYDVYGNSNVDLVFYCSKGFENHDAVYRLISEYGKTLTNKDQGKNLIHKLLLENRLHIQEVKE